MHAASEELELCEAIGDAAATGVRLEVRAGGTKVALGRPVDDAVLLDVSGLSGVVAYDPAELVLTARPATPLSVIAATLDDRHQHLAFEPPDYAALLGARGAATLGGTLAANLSGPRRIAAGAARDHFLGLRAISGRGEAFKSGGRVVKNVTGYDVAKLLAGSFGTLAVMTEVSVKVMPAPEQTVTLLMRGWSNDVAVRHMTDVTGQPLDVSGLAHLPRTAAARSQVRAVALADAPVTALRLEGFPASVADRLDTLRARARADATVLAQAESFVLWREIRDAALLPATGTVWRLSVPPAAGAAVAARIAQVLDSEMLFDWAGGLIWVAPASEDPCEVEVRGALGEGGGHATLFRASEPVRRTCAVFQPQPPALSGLTRRIKDAFDPAGVLNPGRMTASRG